MSTSVRPGSTSGRTRRRDAGSLAWLLPVHAALLAATTLTHQPDPATDFDAYARYVTTDHFLVSHLFGSILGAAFAVVGAYAVLDQLRRRGVPRPPQLGTAVFASGNVLLTAVFAAAAFAQPAIGRAYLDGDQGARALNSDVYGPSLLLTAAAGLVLFGVGAVALGRGMSRLPGSRRLGLAYAWTLPLASVSGFVVPVLQPVLAATAAAAAGLVVARLRSPVR